MPPTQTPPDTVAYMILGYGLTVSILGALVGYLFVKARNLRAEMQTLRELESEPDEKPDQR
jgi:hypothetical protein